MLIRGSAHEEEIHKYVNVDVMVHDNGGKWYLWYECVVFHKFPNWLYFEYGDWRTVDGLCTNDVINSDGKNYQEIFRVMSFIWGVEGHPKFCWWSYAFFAI